MIVAKEIRSLTGIRGVAALYVVILHYFGNDSFRGPGDTFLSHGYLAVDLFFVLSGFVMALNYKKMFERTWSWAGYLKFLGRRIARVYPLYAVATLLAVLLVALHLLPSFPFTPVGFVSNLLMVQTWGLAYSIDQPAWSISAEFAAYLVFPLLLVPSLFRRVWVAYLTGILCVAALAVLYLLPASLHDSSPNAPLQYFSYVHGLAVVRCLAEFTLGLLTLRMAVAPGLEALWSSRWFSLTVTAAIAVLMLIPRTDLWVVMLFPLLLCVLASPTDYFPKPQLSSGFTEMLGNLSYSVYLIHFLLLGFVVWMHGWIHGHGVAHTQTYAASTAILLTYGLGYLSHRWIEIPGRVWLRTLFEGNELRQKKEVLGGP